MPRRQRVRTYLFADLRDSTPYLETRGDAAAVRVLSAYRRIVRAAVTAQRGAEIKTEGDSFYVVFESPGEAIAAALAVVRRIAAHNARHSEERIQAGIGINTGEAIEHDGGYVGSNVIVAHRLCAQARAGQILVTDTVRALVRSRGMAPMREVGIWHLKGIVDAIRVHEVEAGPSSVKRSLGPGLQIPAILLPVPRDGASGLVVCPDLVQRERPLAALASQLDAAAKGAMRVVVLSGEGGIGKSRLCRELAELAERQGFYVMGGRSHGGGDAPYEPFVAALRPYARGRGIEILQRLVGGLVVELRRLLPEIDVPQEPADAGVRDEERRDRFARMMQLLLEDASSLRPVLLVLEDFHQSDAASQDLLRYLVATLRASVCVVCTVRGEDVAAGQPIHRLLTDLDRERRLTRVELAPLDRDGVARMVRALVPQLADEALVSALLERSEGVPFYVEELLKTALDEPPDAGGLALPRTVRDSVQLRVARLVEERGPAVAQLLEAMSVAAVPLGLAVIERIANGGAASAAEDLDAAVAAQLLERAPTQTEIYRFRHALTREAIDDGIPGARRRRLAGAVAEAIEGEGSLGEHAAQLARLYALAHRAGDAVRCSRAAAREAAAVGAYGDAIRHLEGALPLGTSPDDELEILDELASALLAAGRAAEAERAVRRAREIASGRGDAVRLARLDTTLARVLRIAGRRTEAIDAVRRAIDVLERGPSADLAESVATLAELYWAENDAPQAARLAQRALDLATHHGARAVECSALTVLGAARTRLGDGSGIASLEQAIKLGTAHGTTALVVDAYFELSRALLLRGRDPDARAAADAGLRLAREAGLELAQARLLAHLVRICLNQGSYSEARSLAEQAVALARPDTVAAGAAKLALAHVLDNQGQPETALRILEEVGPAIERLEPERRMIFFAYRAQALLSAGRLDEAAASAKSAVDTALASGALGMTAFLYAADVAEARRDASGLRRLAETFDTYVGGRDTAPNRTVRMEMRAILDLVEGRDAVASMAEVASAYESLGAAVRANYRRATSAIARLARPGGRAAARSELRRVRAELRRMGALKYVAIIDRALEDGRAIRPVSGPLAGRELRVASLLSRGLTDARIAQDVGASVAETRRLVSRVREKLGVASRSQVASWVLEQEKRQPASAPSG